MDKTHKNRRYYVDASALPPKERDELFDLFDGWGFLQALIVGIPAVLLLTGTATRSLGMSSRYRPDA